MNFTINGSYAPYLFIVLLDTALFVLQRLNHVRQRSTRRGSSATANVLIDFYCALTAFIASMLSWGTWALAVFVGYQFGIAAGILFFVVGFLGSTLLSLIVPPGFLFELIAHISSLPATPYLALATLRSVNVI